MKRCLSIFISMLCWVPASVASEAIPIHVANFNYTDYYGGIQNWGLDISDEEILYCGNNAGLLRYNGNNWTLMEPDTTATVRAVLCADSVIYTAGDNNIGFWKQRAAGNYEYVSLLPQADEIGVRGETFWNIARHGRKVYFHSFANILCYDGRQLRYVVRNDHYKGLFPTPEAIFTQKRDGSILRIGKDEALDPFCDDPVLHGQEAKFLFALDDEVYLCGLSNGCIYRIEKGRCRPFCSLETDDHLPVRVECGGMYRNRTLAVGTIGHGVFLVDVASAEYRQIATSRLQDLNVHALRFYGPDNLWLSLDNGISALFINPEVCEWRSSASSGIFFDGMQYADCIYMATNRGLFRIRGDRSEQLPVAWYPLQFCNIKQELLCGSTTNLYKLDKSRDRFVSMGDINGVRQFEYVADKGREFLFLRGYSGISVLQFETGTWEFRSYLLGTENYRHILPENLRTIWAVHSQKGIYRLRINPELTAVEHVDNFSRIDGWADYDRISILNIEGAACFFTPRGVYVYDPDRKTFLKKEAFSQSIRKLEDLQNACSTAKNNVWISTKDELYLYRIGDNRIELLKRYSFIANPLLLYDRHFQFRQINDSLTFVSTCQGTVAINSGKRNSELRDPEPRIESCRYWSGKRIAYAPVEGRELVLPGSARNIEIRMTEGLAGFDTSFSYRIAELNDSWSVWDKSGIIRLPMLPSGSYLVTVKDDKERVLDFTLVIEQPFYKRGWAIAGYILIGLFLTIGIGHYVVKRRDEKFLDRLKQSQRRHEEELRRKTYEYLNEKVKDQERELKNNMRFLTQKQELLAAISEEVDHQKKELGERWPNKLYFKLVKLIQSGETETDKLLSFENYFVEIHRDFMLRMQNAHRDLTRSELRLCCLIRSSLSTKEIAAVMGIATRSVELKKYRLKKKLNIEREENLMSYIFSI